MFTNEHLASTEYYVYLKIDRSFINLDVNRSSHVFTKKLKVSFRPNESKNKAGPVLSDVTFFEEGFAFLTPIHI